MAKAPRGSPSFGLGRWRIAVNVVVQVLALFSLLLMVNYLSLTRYERWDLSKYNRYSLAELTRHLLRSLKKDVRIHVLYSSRDQIPGGQILFDDVRNLLREYENASRGKLRVDMVDLYDDVTKARVLQERFRFGSEKNLLIIEHQGRSKMIRAEDLAEFSTQGLFGETPQVTAFRGEQVITSALLALVEDNRPRVGVVIGHGEPGLSSGAQPNRFKTTIEAQNIQLEEVNLATLQGSLNDYRALLIIGPRNDFSTEENALLRAYWNAQGRLLVLLNPRTKTPSIDQFLQGLGLQVDNDLLITKLRTGVEQEGLTLDVYGRFATDVPFVRSLSQATGYFPGGTTSISLDPGKAQAAGLRGTAILRPAFPNYWGEADDFITAGTDPSFDPHRDFRPPLVFGWALEKGGISDQRVQVDSSRMLVIGNADFLNDSSLNRAPANTDFAVLALNWLTDREQLLGIPPKQTRLYFLDFSAGQLDRIFLLVVLLIPCGAGAAGLLVWMARRR
ncbi:MAG: GldG family protein [Verrucomicrobia bacterium]|nr:GldG family protein [Verrucomicrobiota bacterium]